jgi:hypothetical protein
MGTPSVLISNTSGTRPLAEELTQALLDKGIQTWAGFKDLQIGQQWQVQLERAIENAEVFLFLVDPKSRVTPWLEAEWQFMLANAWTNTGKRVLPVVIGSSEPPPFLRNWVSLNVNPTAEPLTWTRRVVDAIEATHSPTMRGLTSKNKRERAKRLSEMGKAVKALDRQPTNKLHRVMG